MNTVTHQAHSIQQKAQTSYQQQERIKDTHNALNTTGKKTLKQERHIFSAIQDKQSKYEEAGQYVTAVLQSKTGSAGQYVNQ
ncbi:hypothetical protein [uncultured Treponema sp.]|uniref:hypothetical protein n=1 Tax=uncultured Treponema sp. TaxID=162155 RepID=UPI0025943979|nr:hypothetical protein [uncultured Treponema sp.]